MFFYVSTFAKTFASCSFIGCTLRVGCGGDVEGCEIDVGFEDEKE
jgi:hypothetical protein